MPPNNPAGKTGPAGLARHFRLRSLKSRLAIWVLLPSLLIIALDFVVAYRASGQIAMLVQQQLLHGAAVMISEQISLTDDQYELSLPPAAFELLRNPYKDRVFYAVYGPDGRLLAGDQQLLPFQGELAADGEAFYLTTLQDEKVRVIAYAYAIPNASQNEMVRTQVAQTLRKYDEFREDLFRSTLRRHFYLLAVIAFFLFVALRWMLKPLVEFSDVLQARQPGSLETLREQDAPRELAPVIHAMNDYVGRLEHTLTAYEKFVANTAHHLRNSFAVITTQINFARRSEGIDPGQKEVLGAVLRALGKCTRIINQLLILASLDQPGKGVAVEKTLPPVPLVPVVTAVIEELAPLGLQKGIELGVEELDASALVRAPVRLLQELLTNLVGNAIQHMQRAGTVSVSVSTSASPTGRETLLTVTDDGVGIPESLRDKVFERFYRVDAASAEGSGLGMAIVKEICSALGAPIRLLSPPGGAGLQVEIRFPAVSPPAAPASTAAAAATVRSE